MQARAQLQVRTQPSLQPTASNRWPSIDWTGATVVIVASGPSLTEEQCEQVRAWRAADASGLRRVIAINTSFRRAPFADAIYGCDKQWWDRYIDEAAATCPQAQLWTQERRAWVDYGSRGLKWILAIRSTGLYKRPGAIHQGSHSGYQAIGLAYQSRARRIVLLGYDYKDADDGRTHWHGDHPDTLRRISPFALWLQQFPALAADLRDVGVGIVNCSPGSALPVFPCAALQTVLQ